MRWKKSSLGARCRKGKEVWKVIEMKCSDFQREYNRLFKNHIKGTKYTMDYQALRIMKHLLRATEQDLEAIKTKLRSYQNLQLETINRMVDFPEDPPKSIEKAVRENMQYAPTELEWEVIKILHNHANFRINPA
jgi:hypothetical protein